MLFHSHRARLRLVALLGAIVVAGSATAADSGALTESQVPGGYELRGVMETGSALWLTADGRYKFVLIVGSVDELDEGHWRIEGSEIVLNTTHPDVPPSFVFVRSGVDSPTGVKVSFEGNDAPKVAGLADVRVESNGRSVSANGIVDGSARQSRQAAPPIEKVRLSFIGAFRRYPTYEYRPTDPTHNHFVFRATLGNYGLVRFQELRLAFDHGDIVMKPPGFGREFRYVRDKAN